MTKAPTAPTTAVPTVQRVDPDVAALRRCIATIEECGWWNGSSDPRSPGAHCVATAIRYNEWLPRRWRLMRRLRKELGGGVRTWNDWHRDGSSVVRFLEHIAAQWEQK